MADRHRRRHQQIPMAPFTRGTANSSPEFLATLRQRGYTEAEIQAHLEQIVALNDRYTVLLRPFTAADGRKMIHLSIKRHDRRVIDDWRDLQAIKNMIVGPERDAVQVFPRETHLVDTSNQWHLWAYMDDDFVLPFGYHYRDIMESAEAARLGLRQRTFAGEPGRADA